MELYEELVARGSLIQHTMPKSKDRAVYVIDPNPTGIFAEK